ncbi:hypothetical protein D9757_010954 [Collybiopsis confluens]|uniref:Uncharacterized protein n=1 Tax=Collybiopsis confluens TaxID=2823264 RepID=A0A8H5GK01_9AGAR|nr:hypothetical protein D9757_010954 [Collybiopsis confluens]
MLDTVSTSSAPVSSDTPPPKTNLSTVAPTSSPSETSFSTETDGSSTSATTVSPDSTSLGSLPTTPHPKSPTVVPTSSPSETSSISVTTVSPESTSLGSSPTAPPPESPTVAPTSSPSEKSTSTEVDESSTSVDITGSPTTVTPDSTTSGSSPTTAPPDSPTLSAITTSSTPPDESPPVTDSPTITSTPSVSSSDTLTSTEITDTDTTTSTTIETTAIDSSSSIIPDSSTIPTVTSTTSTDTSTLTTPLFSSGTLSSLSVESQSSPIETFANDTTLLTSLDTSSLSADTISLFPTTTDPPLSTSDLDASSLAQETTVDLTSSLNVVEAIMTVTPSASTASGVVTLTTLTTAFLTSTLPDGQVTSIPTYTGTVVVTVLPTGKIEPNPFLRNKGAIVGVIVAGALIVAAWVLVLLYAIRKRRQRLRWHKKSPEAPYTERSGRVLIPGHSSDAGPVRALVTQEWRPPLAEEIGEEEEGSDPDEPDDYPGSGQFVHDPMVALIIPKEDYSSLMGAVHNFTSVSGDSRVASDRTPASNSRRPDQEVTSFSSGRNSGLLISLDEDKVSSPPSQSHGHSSSENGHSGWVQIDRDPFADPPLALGSRLDTPDTVKFGLLRGASSAQLILASPSTPFVTPIPPRAPLRLRGGAGSTGRGEPADSSISVSPFSSSYDPYADLDPPFPPSHSSLLNPPQRPKFTETLTDLVRASGFPPIEPVANPLGSPGESIDSYHPDDLLDPALVDSRSIVSASAGGSAASPSSESLVDYVDYTRPISSIVFNHPPTVTSQTDNQSVGNSSEHLLISPTVRVYQNKLFGGSSSGSSQTTDS